MIQKTTKIPLIAAVFFTTLLFSPSISLSWDINVHTRMAVEAIDTLPEPARTHMKTVWHTVEEPDRNRVVSHVNVGECAWMVKKLATKCIKLIKNGASWDLVYAEMGKATHYIQDLNCPHHGIGYYDEGRHETFERLAQYGYWKDADFDGFHDITNYKNFAYNAARFSKRYIKYCHRLTSTVKQSGYYKKLIDPIWDRTNNDTIDLWLSILYQGLGEEGYYKMGLPKKMGTRAEKKVKFDKVDIEIK